VHPNIAQVNTLNKYSTYNISEGTQYKLQYDTILYDTIRTRYAIFGLLSVFHLLLADFRFPTLDFRSFIFIASAFDPHENAHHATAAAER